MKVIEYSAEVARTPQEVFDYVTDATRLPEWQPSVKEAAASRPRSGRSACAGYEVRRVPGGPQKLRWQVTECEPGRRWAIEGIDGPVRAHATIDARADRRQRHAGRLPHLVRGSRHRPALPADGRSGCAHRGARESSNC